MAYTTIDKPSDYFNTVLYTSNNGSSPRTISGVGFQPDFVWVKNRDDANYNHVLNDSVRGLNKILSSDTTGAELAANHAGGYISSANSDGFVVTAGSSNLSNYDTGTNKQVVWNWLASNSTASNEDGSITSTVSANTTSGFSIVSYTGNGTSGATVGHGLSSSLGMLIVKSRSEARNWSVFHQSNGGTKNLSLDTTDAVEVNAARWNNTAPTSSVFTLGNSTPVNNNGITYVAYCFAEKKGYSKFGSYTGNGNASGPYIYTGHKPAAIIIKRTDVAKNWYINDNLREGYNNDNPYISPNLSVAETGGTEIDILSNGFRITASGTGHNQSGGTYIYASIAANPFVTSSGVPACAR